MKRTPVLTTLTALAALWTMAVFGLVPSRAEGAVPQLINFQGILRDGSGNPVANSSYSVVFTIYDAASGGTNLWTETQSVTTTSGLFNVNLGSVNPVGDAVFSSSTRYLGIKVGVDPEMTPRTAMVSVPYSQRTATVDGATAGTVTGNLFITNKTRIGPGTSNAGVNAFSVGANNAADDSAAVALGRNNKARGKFSVVSGGGGSDPADSNLALGDRSTIGGGSTNSANGENATIGGGYGNTAQTLSTVGGGFYNTASGGVTTVAGGTHNTAGPSPEATVGGGEYNIASGTYAAIGGGSSNTAGAIGATIGGGYANVVNGGGATVSGGNNNNANGDLAVIAGGSNNIASGQHATVGGGNFNMANAVFATIPGGADNGASGDYSFAAGQRAKAIHDGAFVWSDASDFINDFASTAANQFLIRAAGGVGIGTESPDARLHVEGGDIFIGAVGTPGFSGNRSLFVENSGGDINNAFRIDGANDQLYLIANSAPGAATGAGIIFRTGTTGAGELDRMAITPGGSVGIGTTTPGFPLDVAGSAHATSFPTSSDIRLKENIEPLTNVLEKIEKIRGVFFDWNETYEELGRSSGHREIGVIAQDVEKVFPELISQWGDEHYRGVDYGRMTAVLIEAVKEQQKQIEKLTKEIEKLKNQSRQARVEN